MDVVKIAAIGIIACFIIALIKNRSPEFALYVSVIAGIIIFFVILGKLSAVFEFLKGYANRFDVNGIYMGTIFKMTGIAYISEFSSEICKDAGESGIASKIELAGKVMVAVLAVPIITTLLDLIVNIMP